MEFQRWLKLETHVCIRMLKDLFGNLKFSKKRMNISFDYKIDVQQPFKPSSTLQQKKKNLQIAAERIRKHVIMPGEVFSFWKAVGNPNKNEFEASRGIRGGVLLLERGGGLCQASGIIYHLSLLAGLEIIERYNHSKDLYTDETRFCPLGSDATVAYGYRDLRVRNNTNTPVYFDLIVGDDCFTAFLCSKIMLKKHDIHFEYEIQNDNSIKAYTIDKENGQILSTSVYEKIDE